MSLLSSLSGLKTLANPWLLLAVVLLLGAAGFQGFRMGSQYSDGKHARETVLIQKAAEAAQAAAADEISKIKIVHQTNQTRLEREIVHVPDFSQCHAGPGALGVLNDALSNKAGAKPASGGLVPKVDGVNR
jgi:hypothetical protein